MNSDAALSVQVWLVETTEGATVEVATIDKKSNSQPWVPEVGAPDEFYLWLVLKPKRFKIGLHL
jgi:hypothetical protein